MSDILDNPLCSTAVEDGLHLGDGAGYPHCVEPAQCKTLGCFWRRWHSIPKNKMSKASPPEPQNGDLFE